MVAGSDGVGCLMSLAGGAARAVDVVFPVLHGPHGEDGDDPGGAGDGGGALRRRRRRRSAVAMDKAMFKVFLARRGHPHARARGGDRGRVGARPGRGARAGRRDASATRRSASRRASGRAWASAPCPTRRTSTRPWRWPSPTTPRRSWSAASAGARSRSACSTATGPLASPVGEITFDAEWYDYDTKYVPGRSRLQVPADLPAEVAETARALALRAFAAVDCHGLARVDFFLDRGRRGAALRAQHDARASRPRASTRALIEAAGIAYPDLVDRLIDLGVARAAEARRYRG